MRLVSQRSDNLPCLAWCLACDLNASVAVLTHGSGVETTEQGFAEGAWDGAFETFGLDSAAVCAGSGGRLASDGSLILATPTHTLEALYSISNENTVFVSNSLVFLLTAAGLELDADYRSYVLDQKTIARGLGAFVPGIPTRGGATITRHYHCNLLLRAGDGPRELEKPEPPSFGDFAAYRDWLADSVGAIVRNASDPARHSTYRPIATISSGYDSPATAALALAAGCNEALTIREASWGPVTDDSGTPVAEKLGLTVHEVGLTDYLAAPGLPEADFVAPGDASDVPMSAFAPWLANRILLTGFHGDKIWDPNNPDVSRRIARGDASGSNLTEFRLRTGFIHLPVPFMGCTRAADIRRISRSSEMDHWRIGGHYDRPIPRRIAEEAGAARESFGQHKLATAVWWNLRPPKPESAASYRAFSQASSRPLRRLVRWLHGSLYRTSRAWSGLADLFGRLTQRLGRRVCLPQIVPRRFTEPADQDLLTQWGVFVVSDRYRDSRVVQEPPSSETLMHSPGDSNSSAS